MAVSMSGAHQSSRPGTAIYRVIFLLSSGNGRSLSHAKPDFWLQAPEPQLVLRFQGEWRFQKWPLPNLRQTDCDAIVCIPHAFFDGLLRWIIARGSLVANSSTFQPARGAASIGERASSSTDAMMHLKSSSDRPQS